LKCDRFPSQQILIRIDDRVSITYGLTLFCLKGNLLACQTSSYRAKSCFNLFNDPQTDPAALAGLVQDHIERAAEKFLAYLEEA